MTLPEHLKRIEEKLDRLLHLLGDEGDEEKVTVTWMRGEVPFPPPHRNPGLSPFAIPNADAETES